MGFLIFPTLLDLATAMKKVRLPTRPVNMRIITTIFETGDKDDVIPKESPTVPIAEIHSKAA